MGRRPARVRLHGAISYSRVGVDAAALASATIVPARVQHSRRCHLCVGVMGTTLLRPVNWSARDVTPAPPPPPLPPLHRLRKTPREGFPGVWCPPRGAFFLCKWSRAGCSCSVLRCCSVSYPSRRTRLVPCRGGLYGMQIGDLP